MLLRRPCRCRNSSTAPARCATLTNRGSRVCVPAGEKYRTIHRFAALAHHAGSADRRLIDESVYAVGFSENASTARTAQCKAADKTLASMAFDTPLQVAQPKERDCPPLIVRQNQRRVRRQHSTLRTLLAPGRNIDIHNNGAVGSSAPNLNRQTVPDKVSHVPGYPVTPNCQASGAPLSPANRARQTYDVPVASSQDVTSTIPFAAFACTSTFRIEAAQNNCNTVVTESAASRSVGFCHRQQAKSAGSGADLAVAGSISPAIRACDRLHTRRARS